MKDESLKNWDTMKFAMLMRKQERTVRTGRTVNRTKNYERYQDKQR